MYNMIYGWLWSMTNPVYILHGETMVTSKRSHSEQTKLSAATKGESIDAPCSDTLRDSVVEFGFMSGLSACVGLFTRMVLYAKVSNPLGSFLARERYRV